MNTFGRHIRVTTFGESHGPAVGCVVDGIPAGVPVDVDLLEQVMRRRRPGGNHATKRKEPDVPVILSGTFEGHTTGAPIAIVVENRDQRSQDYDDLRDLFRPSHADYTYTSKYGHRDHRGGGRSSARETLARVAAGAFARMVVTQQYDLSVRCSVRSIGEHEWDPDGADFDEAAIYASDIRVPDSGAEAEMIAAIETARESGDSLGGVVAACVEPMPTGLGEPIYGKLNAALAGAMMSINGAVGFEMGDGFAATRRRGSEQNDQFESDGDSGELRTSTNRVGGVSGGISNGMPLRFSVGFKPPTSIARPQMHGTTDGGTRLHTIEGRHDPTIVVRAVAVVEAMTWLVLADALLASRVSNPHSAE